MCSLCWSTFLMGLRGWAALGTGAPELGAKHGLNLPCMQQNAALWFMAVSFFSGTFVLGSPDTPPMADVPKVTGPDFPVPEARAWSPGRARGMSEEYFSGCVVGIHGLGRTRVYRHYCRESQCLTSVCDGRAACSAGFSLHGLLKWFGDSLLGQALSEARAASRGLEPNTHVLYILYIPHAPCHSPACQ